MKIIKVESCFSCIYMFTVYGKKTITDKCYFHTPMKTIDNNNIIPSWCQLGDDDLTPALEGFEMKIKLILEDWYKNDSVSPISDSYLFDGAFSSGNILNGTIEVTFDQRLELLAAIAAGYKPVFWIDIDKEATK